MRELYIILNISKDATKKEIKESFRKLSKIKHPDICGDTQDYIKIIQAYVTLIDDKKRAIYDKTGMIDDSEQNKNHIALVTIKGLLNNIIKHNKNSDILSKDIIFVLKNYINNLKKDQQNKIIELEQQYKLILTVNKKFKQKDINRFDIIKSIFLEELENIQISIHKLNYQLSVSDYILELLDNYIYELFLL